MRLRVLSPTHVELDAQVSTVTVEAVDGSFTMRPRHIDTVAVLRPGLLTCVLLDGTEAFVAVDGGTVVKVGADVRVSAPTAIRGTDLVALRQAVDERFLSRAEHEQAAHRALGRLEADVVQRMVDLEEHLRR